MKLSDLLKQTNKLPNVPEVVRYLIQQLNNPAADYSDIAEKVAQDQTLSLKILRLVNSAHFGLKRKVSSIEEAVVMLGMARLKTMVIATGLANSVKKVEGIDLKQFWGDSFQIAALAKWFAEHDSDVDPDIAFTAGLIHNIGRLLLHFADPETALEVIKRLEQKPASRSEVEHELLGFTSLEAGQALLNLWNFPKELGLAILQQEAPASFEEPSPLAAILHLASMINSASQKKDSLETVQINYPKDIAEIAGISTYTINALDEALSLETELKGLLG